jgi:hypothetical protein
LEKKLNSIRQRINDEVRERCLKGNKDPNEELDKTREKLKERLSEALSKRTEKNSIRKDVIYV